MEDQVIIQGEVQTGTDPMEMDLEVPVLILEARLNTDLEVPLKPVEKEVLKMPQTGTVHLLINPITMIRIWIGIIIIMVRIQIGIKTIILEVKFAILILIVQDDKNVVIENVPIQPIEY